MRRDERLEYTEKEKKGIDRVERMNRFFDKRLLPLLGIIIILLLFSFIINTWREKFSSDSQPSAEAHVQQTEPEIFSKRRSLLSGYQGHKSEFEAYGYMPVEGYSYDLSLCKTVDDEMSIFQFSDSSLGELTIINYIPKDKNARYDTLSMAVSSYKLITVTVNRGEESYSVTFLSYDFTSYKADQEKEFNALMKLTDMDEIATLRDIFETDINNLSSRQQEEGSR